MSRPRTREFVYSLLERHGVLQEARRESQLLSSQKRLSGQTAEVMSGGGQAGKGLGNEETENDVSQVSEGPEYTGSGHEDEVMLVASLDLSDLEVQSCPQRAAPQDQSQEPVKKYRKLESLLKLNIKRTFAFLNNYQNLSAQIYEGKILKYSNRIIMTSIIYQNNSP